MAKKANAAIILMQLDVSARGSIERMQGFLNLHCDELEKCMIA